MPLRCLIVDDNPRFARDAAGRLDEEGIDVLGLAADGDEAVRLVHDLRPDLALVDIGLGEESGFDVARRLCPGAVILISTCGAEEFAELIAASPAVGFISKADLTAGAIETLLGGAQRAPTG
jgi:DNA-binding response OmpR family regulator